MQSAWLMPSEEAEEGGGELEGARDDIDSAEKEGKITAATPWQSFVEVATLIFVAEWGDRSMLATIALGASQSPPGTCFPIHLHRQCTHLDGGRTHVPLLVPVRQSIAAIPRLHPHPWPEYGAPDSMVDERILVGRLLPVR